MKNSKRINFISIVLEIVIVIIGITIAFWLNNWSEDQKAKNVEREFLKSIRDEMVKDSTAFDYQVERNKENLKRLNRLIEICKENDFNNDSLWYFKANMLNRSNWVMNTNTYDMLKSGGKLEVITDFGLRSNISSLYSIRKFQTVRIFDIIQNYMDDQFFPYLIKNSDFFVNVDGDISFMEDVEFQNLLSIWTSLTREKVLLYTNTKKDLAELISDIDKNISR